MTQTEATALTAFLSAGTTSDTIFYQLMEALTVAVYMTDEQGRLTYFNRAAVKLSGRTPEIGTDKWCVTWKLFLPDGTPLPADQCPMAVALRGGEVATGIECIAERPDGTRVWFTPCPAILRDRAGRIVGGINLLMDITDRKNAEMEASEQFRAIIETTPECVKIVSPDGTLLFMNQPGVAMIGASSAADVLGKNVYELIAPEDQERFRAFNETICSGKRASLQFDIIGLSGERKHLETNAAPLRHTDGTTVHLAVTHDITERKRAERAPRLLSAIIDSSDDAIISKDLTGVITSWNKSAERLFGYTAEEAIGQTVANLLIPEDRQQEEPNILARLARGERVDHFETVRRRKDGSLIDISLTISPVKNAHGVIVGASKIARDISESKRIQSALLESEARFRQLAETMPQIVWTAQPDGIVDYYNERWFQFTGFGRTELPDAGWERILHPDDLPRTRESWQAAVHSGQPYNNEYRLLDQPENRWRWFIARAVPVRNLSGNIVKWFGTCTDIDEQKHVQEELRRANEDLEQFAFSASHDLQEPLRSIKIYSELLIKRHSGKLDGDALKFMRFLRAGATRMETLVRDLLTYTQVTKFGKPADIVNANEPFKTALANLSGAVVESGAQITSGPLPSLPVHGMHLQQLFQNLIGNAIKYRSPERPPIVHVEASRQNGYWTFSVTDNGIGIDPEYKENIFGLFRRLHSSDEYSGTGIGLAICQRIVDRYHGRIWVESEPGRGSTFLFTLPV
ncbi:MAG TPA: PAS domain S-box protein [Bryobacteraceae bacterium]|jgi:PAS domain S-box-containing protein|nr:PAS domain S-box protein [Bryobacteraceae bacterium]